MASWFLIPMQKPSTPDGRGTVDDPWRVKYLRELGLQSLRGANVWHWSLEWVEGDAAALAQLEAMADVFAVPDGMLTQQQRNRLDTFLARRNLTVDTSLPGPQLVEALILAIQQMLNAETPAQKQAVFAELIA